MEGERTRGLEDLPKGIGFDFTTDLGPGPLRGHEGGAAEGKTQAIAYKQTDADQKAIELEEIQTRAEREKGGRTSKRSYA